MRLTPERLKKLLYDTDGCNYRYAFDMASCAECRKELLEEIDALREDLQILRNPKQIF